MNGMVNKKERANRSKQLRILSNKLQRSFYEKYINTEQTALFEQDNKNNYLFGFTNNYIKIKIPFNTKYCQRQKRVKLLDIDQNGVMKAKLLTNKPN